MDMSDIGKDVQVQRFFAFLRLIGCLYFKKYLSVSKGSTLHSNFCSHSLLATYQNSISIGSYKAIRSIVSECICAEEDRMPSSTSMWRHWQHSCWVATMWLGSVMEKPYDKLPPPENNGWEIIYDKYRECPTVMSQVKRTIDFLTKGCTCKKGCQTQRCGCRKKGNHCGPICSCFNCSNITEHQNLGNTDPGEDSDTSDEDEEQSQTLYEQETTPTEPLFG